MQCGLKIPKVMGFGVESVMICNVTTDQIKGGGRQPKISAVPAVATPS